MDNWVNLMVNEETAAAIVALRPALETLVIRAANDPENVNAPSDVEDKAIQVCIYIEFINTPSLPK